MISVLSVDVLAIVRRGWWRYNALPLLVSVMPFVLDVSSRSAWYTASFCLYVSLLEIALANPSYL
jgi:hypothetical protein